MKNWFYLLVAILLVFTTITTLSSCSKNETATCASCGAENSVDVKQLKSADDRKKGEQITLGYMDTIANMQGRIDMAYASGAIGKSERDKYINDFILPASEYVEGNIKQLDEGKFLKGKFGYYRVRKAFETSGLTGP